MLTTCPGGELAAAGVTTAPGHRRIFAGAVVAFPAAHRRNVAGAGVAPASGNRRVFAAAGVPSAMLFVRSLAGGVSHSPDEHSSEEDVALAVDVLTESLRRRTQ